MQNWIFEFTCRRRFFGIPGRFREALRRNPEAGTAIGGASVVLCLQFDRQGDVKMDERQRSLLPDSTGHEFRWLELKTSARDVDRLEINDPFRSALCARLLKQHYRSSLSRLQGCWLSSGCHRSKDSPHVCTRHSTRGWAASLSV